jgi:hypothetical protein
MTELCADRCQIVADLAARVAQAEGKSERHVRVSLGLTPEYVPPLPRTTTSLAVRHMRGEDEFTD